MDLRQGWFPWSHAADALGVGAVLILALLGALHTTAGIGQSLQGILAWPILVAVSAALVLNLWDPSARWTLAGLYALGLSALGLVLATTGEQQRWLAVPGLGLYLTLAALAWHTASRWQGLAQALAIPPRQRPWPFAWFPLTQLLLALAVIALSLWLCLTGPTLLQRLGAPLAGACLLPAALLLAGTSERPWHLLAQSGSLFLITLILVETAWTTIGGDSVQPWLNRAAWLLAIFSLLTLAYGVLLPRLLSLESGWPAVSRGAASLVGILAGVFLAVVIGNEVFLAAHKEASLALSSLVAVAVSLGLLIVSGLAFALSQDLDPFRLSERGRTVYVYSAEALLLLLLVHLRLTLPELFAPRLGQYWTFVVMGLAFAGVLAGEMLDRLKLRVLAEPLRRTGLFLPLFPVLAFWMQTPSNYSTLWFLLGLLYALLAVLQQNWSFALLAACAGNVGLWLVLHDNQWAFVRYPQLWLVPLALTVLAGAQINRDRLSKQQLNTLRYVALTVIYLASTAETFVSGLGQDIVRPLVLIGLALAGMFLGMLLRIRAFLFLGASFVGMGVLAVVWHAATGHNWVWALAGIVVGALAVAPLRHL